MLFHFYTLRTRNKRFVSFFLNIIITERNPIVASKANVPVGSLKSVPLSGRRVTLDDPVVLANFLAGPDISAFSCMMDK